VHPETAEFTTSLTELFFVTLDERISSFFLRNQRIPILVCKL
jgi:hypothetical protein